MATLYPVRDATAGYIPVIFNYLLCQRKGQPANPASGVHSRISARVRYRLEC